MSALSVNGVTKRFGDACAVDAVTLELGAGEIMGLLGPNGAGKTTLLRMLFGLVRPDAGTIQLLGRTLDETAASLAGVAGFVEDPTFYPYLSGRANLELVRELDRSTAAPAIDDVLDQVGLRQRAGARVSAYSTGMRQRLGLAAALLRAPRLLLLDEPTSGLDPAGARDVGALLRDLAADGVAVLVSSHLIGELESMCHSYTVLRHGRVAWDGTARELTTQAPVATYSLVTADDERAVEVAGQVAGARVRRDRDGGLAVAAAEEALDELVVALADARVPVRRLRLLVSPLASMFFALTSDEVVDELTPVQLAERMLAAS